MSGFSRTDYQMTKSQPRPTFVPKGSPRVIPRIFTDDVRALVAFIKRVFGAEGKYQREFPTQLRVGDSVIMISDTSFRKAMGAFLYVYVENTDATSARVRVRSKRPLSCHMAIAAACSRIDGATPGKLRRT
jgi:hypothetical protein